ncbi:hypothetical protein EUTSA_v10009740mg [Eutrema salsugineum]|uniref:F-box domain-containing protein n=1 Tax=Eutrema salsugineum TaxID=72664 RepID=V4L1Q0_EUTSA|nr:hypothetical protein EUTSA_v10009740mg [Eutrema salsugineum]
MNRGGEILDSFPIDLFLEIFSRLPSKSIARFRCVSNQWRSMLHRPYLTELYLTRSWARPRLLFALRRGKDLSFFSSPQNLHKSKDAGPVVFNPRTRQYASLPKLETHGSVERISMLGFDPIDKQFKVLTVSADPDLDCNDRHRILTLETGEMCWRKIQCPLWHYSWPGEGICINGVLYYLAKGDTSDLIVCFDVRSEKYKFIEVEKWFYYATLINYKGKLGGFRQKYDGDGNTLELHMWFLEDVEKQDWSKNVYALPANELVDWTCVSVVGVTAAGEFVLSMDHIYKFRPFYIFYFGPEKNSLQQVEIRGFEKYYGEVYYQSRHRVLAYVNYVEDLSFNDAKYLKPSQCLNIIRKAALLHL